MDLTQAQLTAFKNAINADANLTAARNAGDHGAIAAYYNAPASPTVSIYRPNVPSQEVVSCIASNTEWGTLSQASRDYFAILCTQPYVDVTSPNVQAMLIAIFPNATTPTTRSALLTALTRAATRLESMVASSGVVPRALFGIIVTPNDVARALAEG